MLLIFMAMFFPFVVKRLCKVFFVPQSFNKLRITNFVITYV